MASSPSSRTKMISRSSSSAFASSSSSFAPRSSPFLTRSSSPTRVNLYGGPSSLAPSSSSSSSSLRFSVDRPGSPRRSMSVTKQSNNAVANHKRTCMCSPTTHPGSFRCAYHKRLAAQQQQQQQTSTCHSTSIRLNLRRSAMKNSLVRIGGVEGEFVKRALTTLIRPSSHHQRRREAFQPKPSRLSITSNA